MKWSPEPLCYHVSKTVLFPEMRSASFFVCSESEIGSRNTGVSGRKESKEHKAAG